MAGCDDAIQCKGSGLCGQLAISLGKSLLSLVVLFLYLSIGAGIFIAIERNFIDEQRNRTLDFRNHQRQLVIDHLQAANLRIDKEILGHLFETYEERIGAGVLTGELTWSFWNSFYYMTTLVTTIGYGNLYCKTKLGQSMTIVLSIFGIPIFLTSLYFLGLTFALLFQAMSTLPCSLLRQNYYINSEQQGGMGHVNIFTIILSLFFGIAWAFPAAASLSAMASKNWSFSQSLYYYSQSLLTIGLGDYVGPNVAFSLANIAFVMIGLSLFISNFFIAHRLLKKLYIYNLTRSFVKNKDLYGVGEYRPKSFMTSLPDLFLSVVYSIYNYSSDDVKLGLIKRVCDSQLPKRDHISMNNMSNGSDQLHRMSLEPETERLLRK